MAKQGYVPHHPPSTGKKMGGAGLVARRAKPSPTLMRVLNVVSSPAQPASRIQRAASAARCASRARMHPLSSVLKLAASGRTPSARNCRNLRRQ